jgi:hypothetical protein
MNRRVWLCLAVLNYGAALMLTTGTARAELSVGIGEIEVPTRNASALLNSALSTFHLMLAELDRKDPDNASKLLGEAIEGVFKAANAYQEAVQKADNHPLSPIPHDEQEAADVAYFWAHASAYKIQAPASQRLVLATAASLVAEFGAKLKNANVRKLESDLRAQQGLAAFAIEMQAFLNSATTVLTIG